MRRWLCGVPGESCTGALLTVNKEGRRMHATPQEAFACFKRHLTDRGYTPIGTREFAAPHTGEITLLSRPSKFGTPLRLGKRGEAGTGIDGNRWTYLNKGRSGCIAEVES